MSEAKAIQIKSHRITRKGLAVGVWFCLLVASVGRAATVEAEGKADGQSAFARSEALTDALREAVRVGAGVPLVKQTQTKDFEVPFDGIFAKSLGVMKTWKVLRDTARQGELLECFRATYQSCNEKGRETDQGKIIDGWPELKK